MTLDAQEKESEVQDTLVEETLMTEQIQTPEMKKILNPESKILLPYSRNFQENDLMPTC